jgi:hypothetical protein
METGNEGTVNLLPLMVACAIFPASRCPVPSAVLPTIATLYLSAPRPRPFPHSDTRGMLHLAADTQYLSQRLGTGEGEGEHLGRQRKLSLMGIR